MPKQTVDDYLAELDHPLAEVMHRLVALLRGADPRIREEIKWHAPSFAIDDHVATTGIEKTRTAIRLVLHTGAKVRPDATRPEVADPAGLLHWRGVDRALFLFGSVEEYAATEAEVLRITREWIAATQG